MSTYTGCAHDEPQSDTLSRDINQLLIDHKRDVHSFLYSLIHPVCVFDLGCLLQVFAPTHLSTWGRLDLGQHGGLVHVVAGYQVLDTCVVGQGRKDRRSLETGARDRV